MKKMLMSFFLLLSMLLSFPMAHANEAPAYQTVGDTKMQLISEMQKDGYLSEKMAKEVTGKYVTKEDFSKSTGHVASAENKSVSWTQYISWINFLKTIAIIGFLIVFRGLLVKAVGAFWHLIVAVPAIVYQATLLTMSLFGTYAPEKILASQYFYIALFCSFATPMILVWMAAIYSKIAEKILEKFMLIFKLGIAPQVIVSAIGMVYFGHLAWMYNSSIFGFFAAVCLSSIFSFSLLYAPGVLFLYFKEDKLNVVVFGHLIVLAIYSVLHVKGMFVSELAPFNIGIQYYCTIAMATGLLVGASPWYHKNTGVYVLTFIVLMALASMGYFFWDLKVVASIIFCFGVLFVLEWIAYLAYSANFLFCVGVLSAIAFGGAELLERYGQYIILALN